MEQDNTSNHSVHSENSEESDRAKTAHEHVERMRKLEIEHAEEMKRLKKELKEDKDRFNAWDKNYDAELQAFRDEFLNNIRRVRREFEKTDIKFDYGKSNLTSLLRSLKSFAKPLAKSKAITTIASFFLLFGYSLKHPETMASNSSIFPKDNLESHVNFYLEHSTANSIRAGRKNAFQESLERISQDQDEYIKLCMNYAPKFKKAGYDLSPKELLNILNAKAIIESDGQSRKRNGKAIRSRAGAIGRFQIMKVTGKRLDLAINKWVDERLDPIKSANATLRFLYDLASKFDDIYTVVAAYNWGPTNVKNFLKEKGHKTILEAKRGEIPRETFYHVINFAYTKNILDNKKDYGIIMPDDRRIYSWEDINQGDSYWSIKKRRGVRSIAKLKECNPYGKHLPEGGYKMRIPVTTRKLVRK